jgi:uncharacterized Zn finger protein
MTDQRREVIRMLECPACGSNEAVLLGQLGQRVHLRCRDCGIGYSVDAGEVDLEESDD